MGIMSIMKSSVLVLMVLLAIGCKPGFDETKDIVRERIVKSDTEFTGELRGLYYGEFEGQAYRIIEIEGHRYLTQHNGGIMHLESCKCIPNEF